MRKMDPFTLILLGITIFIKATDSYVLLQVRKADNHSNVDALIHKVVSSDKFDRIANKISRKQYTNQKFGLPNDRANEKLDNIVIAINTNGDSKDSDDSLGENAKAVKEGIDEIAQTLKNFAIGNVKPAFKAKKDEYGIKSDIVNFRNGKPSLVFELNTDSIITAIKDFLTSKLVRKYADVVAQKAAVVYRAVKDEIKKEKRSRDV